ncbi:MAG: N-acetyl-gamma-glutamyl-phosphate reductase [Lachnospira sp.]|nr:N-acetyl-gamma-glutamyl-phosphate reductase [Lachnospira sp.]
MKTKVYIDGQSGTTGLQIYERIGARDDLELMRIDEDKRHDLTERKKYINAADIVFLCLPDAGAREAVSLIDSDHVRVIDASTAHRTADGWVYGFPELSRTQREDIAGARFVANPGCHATGLISTAAPLVRMGILPADYPLACFSLTGFTGGGKKMIAQYAESGRPEALDAPGIYGLNQRHKHLPEMQKYTGLAHRPVFLPVVDDFAQGMASTIQLQTRLLAGHPGAREVRERLAEYYAGETFVRVAPFTDKPGTLYANALAGTNFLEIHVCGDETNVTVTALFDNLGKGASGAAVQNMNIMLGLPEETGLV